MKNITLNSVEDLTKLKESLNSTIDKKIEEKKLNESVKTLDKLTLGELKHLFESISGNLFDNNKKLVCKYVKTIKENKDLKTLYSLYETVLNPKYTTDSTLLVNSLVSLSEGLNKKNITEGVKKISSILKESILVSNVESNFIENCLKENQDLLKSIDYIFTNKKDTKNIFEHTNKMHTVVNYVNENMKQEETTEKNNNDLIKELNESLDGLEPWESDVIKDISLYNLSESNKQDLFYKYKQECIQLLESKIEESTDIEEVSRFKTMKTQLENKECIDNEINENLFKLSELKYTLKD